MSVWVGIDPGRKGGVVVLGGAERRVELAIPMPVIGREVHVRRLVDLLGPYLEGVSLCLVERAQALPGNGGAGMFNYGRGYGRILGMLEALQVRHATVRPADWQRGLGVSMPVRRVAPNATAAAKRRAKAARRRELKARVIRAALALLPDLELVPPRHRVPHDGVADAAGIALHAWAQDGAR